MPPILPVLAEGSATRGNGTLQARAGLLQPRSGAAGEARSGRLSRFFVFEKWFETLKRSLRQNRRTRSLNDGPGRGAHEVT